MQNFRNLKVWQKAHELALLVYRLTADSPREEMFGLRHSLRKTAVELTSRSDHDNLNQEIVEVRKMLSGFNRKLA